MQRPAQIVLIVTVAFCALLYWKTSNSFSTVSDNTLVPYTIDRQINTANGMSYELSYTGNSAFYKKPSSPISKVLFLEVIEDSDSEVTFIITDKNSFHVPENKYFPSNKMSTNTGKRLYKYDVMAGKDSLFRLQRILADGASETIFDTTGFSFIYSALYTSLSTSLNNDFLYGFGERRKNFRYNVSGNFTTFPKDKFIQLDSGKPDEQLYGYHPMWLKKEQSGNFHTGFLKSTSPLLTEIDAGKSMTLHIVGGQVFLKFFLGDAEPEKVIKAYHSYINGYIIHPFWAQGYHHLRWGYKSSRELLDIQQKFQDSGFPIDTIWNDLDYMQDYKDFTLQELYTAKEMNQLTDRTKDIGLHWIPLIDIGVALDTDAATDGLNQGVFLNSSIYPNETLVACVWPGPVYFPDWNHPNAFSYWNVSLFSMHTKLGLNPSGYWLDMNENSNFIPGERGPNEPCPAVVDYPKPQPNVDDSLWIPFNITGNDILADKTVTMTTMHYQGDDAQLIPGQNTTELFFHPLNPLGEGYASHESLKSLTKSPLAFQLTRGSMYGSGRYAAHWTGDNLASWEYMGLAVAELLPFQLFGIPMVGSDLCGFYTNTNAELCTRWMQLGAWMTFSRNHNSNESIAQEPFAFKEDYVLPATRQAFLQRYAFLKWMYSLFVRNWDRKQEFGTGTVMKPLWWLFSSDEKAYLHEDTQFMMGEEIMIAPVLKQGNSTTNSTNVNVYFPGPASEGWVDPEHNGIMYKGGQTQLFEVAFTQNIPYFLRAGYIVHKQQAYDKPALRSRFLDNKFDLLVVLKINKDQSYSAFGKMMTLQSYDDQNVYDSCLKGSNDCLAHITVQGTKVKTQFHGSLEIAPSTQMTQFQEFYINQLVVYGLDGVYNVDIKKSMKSGFNQAISFDL